MKRLVLSGSKYKDDDACMCAGQLSHVILYIYLLLFFYYRPEGNAGDV